MRKKCVFVLCIKIYINVREMFSCSVREKSGQELAREKLVFDKPTYRGYFSRSDASRMAVSLGAGNESVVFLSQGRGSGS